MSPAASCAIGSHLFDRGSEELRPWRHLAVHVEAAPQVIVATNLQLTLDRDAAHRDALSKALLCLLQERLLLLLASAILGMRLVRQRSIRGRCASARWVRRHRLVRLFCKLIC